MRYGHAGFLQNSQNHVTPSGTATYGIVGTATETETKSFAAPFVGCDQSVSLWDQMTTIVRLVGLCGSWVTRMAHSHRQAAKRMPGAIGLLR